jgi:D-alanyl-D-alanine carboxypeptidase
MLCNSPHAARLASSLLLATALSGCGLVDRVGGVASGLFNPSPARSTAAVGSAKMDQTSTVAMGSLEKLAREMLAAGDPVAALPLVRRAESKSPQSVSLALLHGEVALAANQAEEALSAFERAAALDDGNARAIAGRGVALLALGRDREAHDALSTAVAMADAPVTVLSNAGLALAMLGDSQSAIRILERAVSDAQSTPRTRQNLALAYALAGDRDRALAMALVDMDRDSAHQQMARWSQLDTQVPAQRLAFVSGRTYVAPENYASGDAWRDQSALAALRVIAPVSTDLALATPATPKVAIAEPKPEAPVAPASAMVEAEPPAGALLASLPAPDDSVIAAPAVAPLTQVTRIGSKTAPAKPKLARAALREPIKPQASSVGNWTIQLGNFQKESSLSSFRLAIASPLETAFSSLVGSLRTVSDNRGGQAPTYRLVIGSFATSAEAKPVCASMRQSNIDCFVWSTAASKASVPVKMPQSPKPVEQDKPAENKTPATQIRLPVVPPAGTGPLTSAS